MIFQCDINAKWEVVGFAAKSALQYLYEITSACRVLTQMP